MGVDALKDALPEHARDLRLNLGSVVGTSALSEQRLWGTLLATAVASRDERVVAELAAEARQHLSATAYQAALAAASIMAMNNVYYRGRHLLAEGGVTGYDELPARLRMQVIGTHGGVDRADFELWCFAVSAVHGCGTCLVSHERVLREAGTTKEQIHEALRIAAVVHAVAVTLAAERVPAGT